ncbi:MAG TPA: hypothetical protein DHD79_04075 [Firmicutes bacterium]|nr:hypothetical protein [Bacillota bacterium]HBE06138.1 hypothetical protein [Bacillota bacterium]HBL50414.1 hypothetical protein [Bacillota bacterium]HBR23679.1 hypothetical protein [Bacillota bacterium]HCM18831.1 hypothetical protein [Bacillota bacterium]
MIKGREESLRTIKVVAAIVIQNDQVLLARRPPEKHHGLLWEFPGGKVEAGESPAAALARELREELNWDVVVGPLFDSIARNSDGVITEVCFYLTNACPDSTPQPLEGQEIVWANSQIISQLALTPADAIIAGRLLKDGQIRPIP